MATPIGNLDDLSPRAAAALAGADLVAAEDTRRTRVLLDRLGASVPLTSYHEHNEERRAGELLDRVERGEVVAVATDAGTPLVSDPGYRLVVAAVERGVRVEAVPGPSAVLQALVLSGLPTDRFAFEGFLPRKAGLRRRRLEALADDPRTLVFFVAPHRAADDLAAMADAFGDERRGAIARELTKLHEEVVRGPLRELAARAAAVQPRGEVTAVVAGATAGASGTDADLDAEALSGRVLDLVALGVPRTEAVARVARATGRPRREVYDAALGRHADGSDGPDVGQRARGP